MRLELTPEQEQFRQEIERFAREEIAPLAAHIDESGAFPRSLIARAGTLGLTGVTISKQWQGAARDYVSYAVALEAVARESATVAVILAVNNSLVAETIEAFGTARQKARWLPQLATGATLGAFALSEQNAGTDAANQTTRATRDGSAYRIDGHKVWVANGDAAGVAIVFAATTPGIGGRGVSAFLVPMDAAGVRTTGQPDSLGVRGLGCIDLELQAVSVPEEDRLGEEGQGFKVALWALEGGRIAIAAQALGVGQAALDAALTHARQRRTFGQPIASYQAIQWMVADMATDLEAARLLTYKAAGCKGVQERNALEASMAKLAASEAAHRAADRAMQILASAGYRRGSAVERVFRDARATEIYQGTSEVQRMIIAANILA